MLRTTMTRSVKAIAVVAICMVVLAGCSPPEPQPASPAGPPGGPIDRTVLPVVPKARSAATEIDARNAKMPERFEVKPPAGAPNVVVILIDDLGFGATSPFGGPIATPTFERLAQRGLRYNNFHTRRFARRPGRR
jgi:arylsulfatase